MAIIVSSAYALKVLQILCGLSAATYVGMHFLACIPDACSEVDSDKIYGLSQYVKFEATVAAPVAAAGTAFFFLTRALQLQVERANFLPKNAKKMLGDTGTAALFFLVLAVSVPNASVYALYIIFHTCPTVLGWSLQIAWLWVAVTHARRAARAARADNALERTGYDLGLLTFCIVTAFLLLLDTAFPIAAGPLAKSAGFGHLHSAVEAVLIACFVYLIIRAQYTNNILLLL